MVKEFLAALVTAFLNWNERRKHDAYYQQMEARYGRDWLEKLTR